jgi:flavin reductase (DIM6/NTAB) family NADH-FMN oxidoreductase RutF
MAKRVLPLDRVYGLLEAGPVVLVTTAHRGRSNIMAMTWQTMLEFVPPLVGCVVSNRNFSFELLRRSRECAINVPQARLAARVIGCGDTSGRRVDKFARFGFTPLPARRIDAPLIAECFANLECRVVDTRFVNRYNFFVLEVVQAWRDPGTRVPPTLHHRGSGVFAVDGRMFRMPFAKMN